MSTTLVPDPFSLRQLLPPQCQSGPMVLVAPPEQLLTLLQQHVYNQRGKKWEWKITNRIGDIIQEWCDAPQNICFAFLLPTNNYGKNKLYIRMWPHLAQADPISPPPITTRSYLSTASIVFFRFSGEVKRLCHVSVLVRQVPKPASPYFAVFHKGVGGGKYRAGALFLLTGAGSDFAALYLVS